jgi:hypothetical protein
MLRELGRLSALPKSALAFEGTLRALNQAAHGISVEPDAATRAMAAAARFLDDLRSMVKP